jgi:hypothetical protein
MAVVYWLHLPEHTDMFKDGYVGVASDFRKRMRSHKHRLKHIWANVIAEIVVIADSAYCLLIEQKLRPSYNIGWNKAIGGMKGHIMYGEHNPNFGKLGEKSPNYQGSYICPLGEFDRTEDIEKLYGINKSTVIRRCKGRMVNGKFLQPHQGWAFMQKGRVTS